MTRIPVENPKVAYQTISLGDIIETVEAARENRYSLRRGELGRLIKIFDSLCREGSSDKEQKDGKKLQTIYDGRNILLTIEGREKLREVDKSHATKVKIQSMNKEINAKIQSLKIY